MKRFLSYNTIKRPSVLGTHSTQLFIFFMTIFLYSCYPDESLNVDSQKETEPTTELDIYIEENFTEEYNIAIRYKFVDKFVDPGERVTPPKIEMVRPMLDFIEHYWIEPYLQVQGGEEFFRRYVPGEIVFLGGLIYNQNGTVTLGTADAGARITFTNVNALDPSDEEWRALQLRTTYHEFAHIIHQEFSLPASFDKISPQGYTSSGSWFVLTDEAALQRGFVSPYGTSSPNEDFAELVAFFLFEPDFYGKFVDLEQSCVTAACEAENAGKQKILEKLVSITDHYLKVTGLDLNEIRAAIQSRL